MGHLIKTAKFKNMLKNVIQYIPLSDPKREIITNLFVQRLHTPPATFNREIETTNNIVEKSFIISDLSPI